MKLIVFCVFLCAVLEVQCKIWDKDKIIEESIDRSMRKRGMVKNMKPMTPKQRAWWDSLGKRSKHESKANVKTRKEIRQLTATEFQRYTDAINMANTIRPDPDDDRTMWQLLVLAHPYINAPSAHIGAALLPWHREYCWRVERAIQSVDPEVALHFWDSVIDQKLPLPSDTVVFHEDLLGTVSGPVTNGPYANFSVVPVCLEDIPFDTIYRQADMYPVEIQKALLWTEEEIQLVMNQTMFADIAYNGSFFEAPLHDNIHIFVAGTQLNVDCSPSDPWFFTHHSHIDMLWELFRQNSQVTPIETEYPSSEDGINVGMGHEAFDLMIPFDGLYNIHGISTHYTDYYYNYQARDYLTCQTTEDCPSPYLWCETSSQECYTKVRPGGVCTGLTEEACYGDNVMCVNDVCTPAS